MQLDGDVNGTPAVGIASDMRGGIPTATVVDTPTVGATLAMRLSMVQTIIQDANDGAIKRAHNTNVSLGHMVHPSKVPKLNPQANLNPSSNATYFNAKHIH